LGENFISIGDELKQKIKAKYDAHHVAQLQALSLNFKNLESESSTHNVIFVEKTSTLESMKVQYKELEDQLNALTKRSKEYSDNLREKDAVHSHACQSNGWVSTIPAFTSVQGTWRARARDVQSKVQRAKEGRHLQSQERGALAS
jgi:hypothetical protein